MSDDFRSRIFEMMDHMEENGKISAMVDGEEVEAETAEEQMALFQLRKEQEYEAQLAAERAARAEETPAEEEAQEALADSKTAKAFLKWADRCREESEEAKEDPAAEKEAPEDASAAQRQANLWGGRFTKPTAQKVFDFNASISFDCRLFEQDVIGSMVHASMLGRIGVLTQEEAADIIHALGDVREDVSEGRLAITNDYEDIHSFTEAQLIERLGDTGKKVHTGRSRNDQVALDMRLYCRGEVLAVDERLERLLRVIYELMKQHVNTIMPGFTHLQKAQPTTLAHHLGAYFEMFKRDRSRMEDTYRRMNYCPLGSWAFAGTTYPLDREYTSAELGFFGPTLNSMDSVSDRDYLIEYLSAASMIMMHLSRFCEEIILWNSNEYHFVEIDDAYSTGSSIMPQKKNPDIAELIRGKTGRVYGALTSLLTTMKGIPLAYNKDMQEDKELVFDAMDTVKGCIGLFTGMISTMQFNKEAMAESARHGFTNATDAADYLVNHGVPFRDAHGIIGRMVLYCIDAGKALDDLMPEEFQSFSPVFGEDIYDAISMETCVNKRLTIGAPGKAAMERVIQLEREYLNSESCAIIGSSGGNTDYE